MVNQLVRRSVFVAALLLGTFALALLSAACGKGEDRPNVEIIGGAGSVSISGISEGGQDEPAGRKYAFSTDQTFNQQISLDILDVRRVINVAIDGRPVEWARAIEVYEHGKNQRRPDGSLRTLASLADAGAHAVFPNGPVVYGRPNFIDATIRDGLTGTGRAQGLSDDARREIVDHGLQMLLYAKASQELAAARALVEAKTPGANVPVDAGWAILSGMPDADGARQFGLLPVVLALEPTFKLQGKVAQPLEDAFIAALIAAERNDAGPFAKPSGDARAYLNGVFTLGVLRSALSAERAGTEAARQVALAEGWSTFQTIRATVAGVSPSAAQSVEAAFNRSAAQSFAASETQRVYQTLNEPAVLQALGLPAAIQVKTPPAGS